MASVTNTSELFPTSIEEAGAGNAWTSPSNAAGAVDTVYATVAAVTTTTKRIQPDYAMAFAIPNGATVRGIEVKVYGERTSGVNGEWRVQIFEDGTTAIGTEQSAALTGAGPVTIGSIYSDFGLSEAQRQASYWNDHARFGVYVEPDAGGNDVRIDAISITVYYLPKHTFRRAVSNPLMEIRMSGLFEESTLDRTVLLSDGQTVQRAGEALVAIPLSTWVATDGSTTLTGNWDAGSWQIRAQSFYSDVATGTAPLVIASTTVVSNLNADLLDGSHASAFATASHAHAASDITSGTLADARVASSNVTQHSASVFAGGIRTGTAPPSSPTAGMQYYDTVDETVYTYDATRGHWFGPLEWMDFGTNSVVSDGEIFRSAWGSVQPSTSQRGWIPPYDCTAVGLAGRNGAFFTGSFEIVYNTTGSGVTIAFSAAEKASDMTLDYDIGTADSCGVRINITSGTGNNPTARLYFRRRKA